MGVVIYSSPTCVYCRQTKVFFRKNRVDFVDKDVSDPQIAQEMIDLTQQMAVPVVIIEEDDRKDVVIGFQEQKLRQLLHLESG